MVLKRENIDDDDQSFVPEKFASLGFLRFVHLSDSSSVSRRNSFLSTRMPEK